MFIDQCFDMGNMFRLGCAVENWRVLRIPALMFAVVLILQYFELPYGNISSLLSTNKAEVASNGNFSVGNSSSSLHKESSMEYVNLTSSNAVDPTDSFTVNSAVNESTPSNEKELIGKHSDANLEHGAAAYPEDELPSKDDIQLNDTAVETIGRNHSFEPVDGKEHDIQVPDSVAKFPANDNVGESIASTPVRGEVPNISLSSPQSMAVPLHPPVDLMYTRPVETNSASTDQPFHLNSSTVDKGASATATTQKNDNSVLAGEKSQSVVPSVNFTLSCLPGVKEKIGCPKKTIMSISEMNDRMLQSLASSRSMKPRWSSTVDRELEQAKFLIQNSPEAEKDSSLYAPLYRNVSMFHRSYTLMEQTLKVYIYKEGEKPIFHQPVLKGIYASEGWFMRQLKANKNFVTKKMKKAHLFYLPFSSRMLEETLYVVGSHSHKNLIEHLNNYLTVISGRYRFWNRTDGADHFVVACHDWAPTETRNIMASCIRALCNADVTGGFTFGKDVSLPETYIKSASKPLRQVGGEPPSNRNNLAFFAGNMHGYLRPLLVEYWENKDPDMKIFGPISKAVYVQYMKRSKYCICARGYEVNSPRVIESIFYECVPVILSDNFVPPLFETLNWEAFAVFVPEKDIPNLKNILLAIPDKKYLEMQRRVRLVQQHFLWHPKPVKYDLFYMILHSIWFTRVFQMAPR